MVRWFQKPSYCQVGPLYCFLTFSNMSSTSSTSSAGSERNQICFIIFSFEIYFYTDIKACQSVYVPVLTFLACFNFQPSFVLLSCQNNGVFYELPLLTLSLVACPNFSWPHWHRYSSSSLFNILLTIIIFIIVMVIMIMTMTMTMTINITWHHDHDQGRQ